MKKVIKAILEKIPLFLFCVLFISGYNSLFGSENSTIGVTILTALLIFLKGDLGYKAKQVVGCFPVLFLLMGIAPKLASYNAYLGIAINFIAIMVILILSSYNYEEDYHIPFLLGYIFAQGYQVSGVAFEKRMISLVVGSILVSLIYFMRNAKKEYKLNLSHIFREVNISSYRTQWYIKLAFGLTLVAFLGDLLNYPRTMWISFTILSLTYHDHEERQERQKYRIPATLVGSILFFLIFRMIPVELRTMFCMVLGFGMMFIHSYDKKTAANSVNALISAFMTSPSYYIVLLRIVSNVIGVGISHLNHLLFDKIFNQVEEQSM